jgi:hypothetical protein
LGTRLLWVVFAAGGADRALPGLHYFVTRSTGAHVIDFAVVVLAEQGVAFGLKAIVILNHALRDQEHFPG